MLFDTIAAVATAKGDGGVAIIRISGDKSFEILDKIFTPINNTKIGYYRLKYGNLHDGDKIIDEVMAVRMKAPRSYTCENVVEINCHGGQLMTNRVLQLVLKNGARMAQRGEFTKRAFMNGRIDLSQAEAVIDIINGNSEKALDVSLNQLRGDLKDMVKDFKKTLLDIAAHVNVVLDYPEEGIEDPIPKELLDDLKKVHEKATRLIESYDKGKVLKDGIKTVIVGKPNVGKSTLLNALLREDRAIVTEVAGTTRDTIEEKIMIKGIPLILVDTAGIRKTDDIVESIGVQKSRDLISKSDLVLMLLDITKDISEDDKEIIDYIKKNNKKVIYILNKNDKPGAKDFSYLGNTVSISAMKNIGIDEMEEYIYRYIAGNKVDNTGQECILNNVRHKAALEKTKQAIENMFLTIDNEMPLDLISVDLKEALDSLSEITGEITSEDILDHIFKSFCVGK